MRVALYVRVSTQEQGIKGLSVDAQTAALEEYAKSDTIAGIYKDIGVSGRRPHNKRPEMVRLLKDIEAGKIDLVLFVRLDRWFRSVKEYYKVQDVLDRHNVSWRAIQEDYETESSSGRFKVNIMLSVAQSEAERTGDRIRAINEFKRSKGEFLSGNVPLGTKLENKVLVPNDEAYRVKEMFSAFLSAGSVHQAILILQSRSITVGARSLQYILRNENYRKLDIIPQDQWDRVQELLSVKRPKAKNTRTYLFTGLLFCPCGRRMGGLFSNGNYYYHCPGHYQNRVCSNSKCYRESDIEQFFLDTIVSKVKDVNLSIKQARKEDPAPIKRRMDKLTELYLDDRITKERYDKEYLPLKEKLGEIESSKPINEEEVMTVLEAYHTLSRQAKRAFWYRLIKHAVLSEDGINYTPIFIK